MAAPSPSRPRRVALAFVATVALAAGTACGDTTGDTTASADTTGDTADAGTTATVTSTTTVAATATTTTTTTTAATVTVGTGPEGDCVVSYRVIDSVPHDPEAFTQGLVVDGDVMYESTGLYGASTIRTVDPDTGQVLAVGDLPAEHFGEGLALARDRLYQLTWREGVVHVYDLELTPLTTIALDGEGWGLTTDGDRFVLSDGTSELRWVDPATFATTRRVTVTDDGEPVPMLNELELVDGAVLANLWLDDVIVVIDPASGEVTGRLDLGPLVPPADELTDPADDVLNGIALDPATGHVYVTGKRWPQLHELELDRECWPSGTSARP